MWILTESGIFINLDFVSTIRMITENGQHLNINETDDRIKYAGIEAMIFAEIDDDNVPTLFRGTTDECFKKMGRIYAHMLSKGSLYHI